ncbi:MAG TPA: hypothetical protein VLQ89_09420, partial [Candidatus Binatia bacterium]|nr:hypothetical protein [Candidatus Binatia bacterium]
MKKMLWTAGLLILSLSLPAATEKELIKSLPQRYKVWLTEEVGYIIAAKEKEVFLQLETDLERES